MDAEARAKLDQPRAKFAIDQRCRFASAQHQSSATSSQQDCERSTMGKSLSKATPPPAPPLSDGEEVAVFAMG